MSKIFQPTQKLIKISNLYAYEDYLKNPDDTHRLFYVACTRTEKNLFIMEPKRSKAYDI